MRVDKPWGYELRWAKTERYVGKIIHVDAGQALSLQYHRVKDETLLVWSGRIRFETGRGDTRATREMGPGDSVHIAPGTVHRMTALETADIFEVSTTGARGRGSTRGPIRPCRGQWREARVTAGIRSCRRHATHCRRPLRTVKRTSTEKRPP